MGTVKEAEVTKDGITLRFVELGEGSEGDYNPDDPEDAELLRVDVLFDGEEVDSYCTLCRASLTYEERMTVLGRWMQLIGRSHWKPIIQRLTWEVN